MVFQVLTSVFLFITFSSLLQPRLQVSPILGGRKQWISFWKQPCLSISWPFGTVCLCVGYFCRFFSSYFKQVWGAPAETRFLTIFPPLAELQFSSAWPPRSQPFPISQSLCFMAQPLLCSPASSVCSSLRSSLNPFRSESLLSPVSGRICCFHFFYTSNGLLKLATTGLWESVVKYQKVCQLTFQKYFVNFCAYVHVWGV